MQSIEGHSATPGLTTWGQRRREDHDAPRTGRGSATPLAGDVEWLGRPVRSASHRRAREGLAFISDERSVIFELTVQENLRLGGASLDVAFELFPELVRLGRRKAGLLSGGKQQILTMARPITRPEINPDR